MDERTASHLGGSEKTKQDLPSMCHFVWNHL